MLKCTKCNWREDIKKEELEQIPIWKEELISTRNAFVGNVNDYEKGMQLLKEQYCTNINRLKEYGLEIRQIDII